jgi:hypothetical protein
MRRGKARSLSGSRLQAKINPYADDYVICCKGDVDEAITETQWMMRPLKLTLNEAKTRMCRGAISPVPCRHRGNFGSGVPSPTWGRPQPPRRSVWLW